MMSLNLGTAVAMIDLDISDLQEKAKRAEEALKKLDAAGTSAFAKDEPPSRRKKPAKRTPGTKKGGR